MRRLSILSLLFFLLCAPCFGAFTERYVSVAGAGAHDGTSAANAWTLAEALTNLVAGERGNVIKGAYSSGADAVTNAGTNQASIVLRGYNSSIGDLTGARTGGNGEIIVTNYPVVTLTGRLSPTPYSFFEAMKFTGAVASPMMGDPSADNWGALLCVFENTSNNASARTIQFDNFCRVIGSDLTCTGATHDSVIDGDESTIVAYNRIQSTANDCVTINYGSVVGNVFFGDSSSDGVVFISAASSLVAGNTFYGLDAAVYFSVASQMTNMSVVVNNHATDNAKYLDAAYVATANQPVIEINNRTRDNTTPRTGISDFPVAREITTDTGGAATDYEDAGAGDFNLISGAPGRGTGLGRHDVGALQHEDAGGGSSGGAPLVGGRLVR